jgi:sulfane dehydrogenase subunit SoxC
MQMRSHLSDTDALGKGTVQLSPSSSRINRFLSRRRFIAMGATLGALALPQAGQELPRELGTPLRAYGDPSPFEKIARYFKLGQYPASGGTATPLQDLYGIITPSALHFVYMRAGVPAIAPADHRLMIHGFVRQPLVLTMDDLKRLPSVSRVHFIECAGNSGAEHIGKPRDNPTRSHGLASCTEWTGVLLSTLLTEVGLKPEARWVLAEGADACRMARSLPIEKAMDDIIVAYGQNGEALRPEQGYPLRLVVPGWEGNTNVKWLRRLHVLDQPAMTREEAVSYTDLMPDGKARQFTFVMEAKSVVTRPAGGQRLASPGYHEITGLAWSGRGRINQVEVSTDGGQAWRKAELQEPIHTKAFVRFRMPWVWDGSETAIASRCQDETGYWQPTREEIVAVRGMKATDHYNGIKWWRIHANGELTHA